MYTEIAYEVSERVATITLNRPSKLNAWTPVMGREMRQAAFAADADPEVRVIILTGAGKGFCAGADLALLSDVIDKKPEPYPDYEQRPGIPAGFQRAHSYFPSLTKPVIAAVNGAAAGLGFIYPLYCDLRYASQTARFSTAFSRRGLIAEYGIAWILPRLIGAANAMDLMLSARLIDADEALRMGLVNAVYPDEGFLERVQTYARDLANNVSPRSMAVLKRQMYNGMYQTLDQSLEMSEAEMRLAFESEDFREGLAHFFEKRPPEFTGR
ncbi:MAG: enoyl-CoA hydratase [Acidobacteria bacterium]|nr:enoyl-CoA hydratase [Acidobacteriota bacterium]